MGPLVSAKQRDRVLGYIDKGQRGGRQARRSAAAARRTCPKGWFVEPTLFVDVDNSMTIAQEEIFGPVLAVIPYDDDDDAVRIANDSGYGLSGGVFSASDERATAIARRIRTGSIGVNGGLWYGADSPYGGYKASGDRAPERPRRVRAVPRDQGRRLARDLSRCRSARAGQRRGARMSHRRRCLPRHRASLER